MTITREIVRMLDKRDQKPPVGNHAHPQYLTTAVTSLKKTGGTSLTGNVELAEGANIILTQDDVLKKITIAAGGVSTFIALTDTPADYVAQAGKAIVVKSTEDGIEFGVAPSGGVFSQTFGDGIATTFDLVHNLNTADVLIELWDLTTGTTPQLATSAAQLYEAIDVNTVKITFSVAPAINKYRAVIISSGGAVGVSTIKTTGGAGISGDVEFTAGTNVTLTQDDALKKITIAASGGVSKQWFRTYDRAPTVYSTSAFKSKGFVLKPDSNFAMYGVAMLSDEPATQTLRIAIYELDPVSYEQIGAALEISPTFIGKGINTSFYHKFSAPRTLLAGSLYVVAIQNMTVGATLVRAATGAADGDVLYGLLGDTYGRIASQDPAAGAIWEVVGGSVPFHGSVLIEI